MIHTLGVAPLTIGGSSWIVKRMCRPGNNNPMEGRIVGEDRKDSRRGGSARRGTPAQSQHRRLFFELQARNHRRQLVTLDEFHRERVSGGAEELRNRSRMGTCTVKIGMNFNDKVKDDSPNFDGIHQEFKVGDNSVAFKLSLLDENVEKSTEAA